MHINKIEMNSPAADNRLLWGWETFIQELRSLLIFSLANRQYGVANESSSYRMLERLQAGIVSLSSLRGHLLASYDSGRVSDRLATQEQMEVLSRYLAMLNQLVTLLQAIVIMNHNSGS